MTRTPRIPSYRQHSSGQARVTLHGKDHLLGPYGSKESREAYNRLVREWLDGRDPTPREEKEGEPLSVDEVVLGFWKFAREYYSFDGKRGDEACFRDALRLVSSLCGSTRGRVRPQVPQTAPGGEMVARGWSRNYVNAQVNRVKQMFRWAAEEELIPPAVYHGLLAVRGLRRGKTDAGENEKVRPVPREYVELTLPFLSPTVRAMVRFQLLTGCRPDEACRLRPRDLDKSNPSCWVYRPGSDQGAEGKHKTAHHGHERLILVGPQAQEVLEPFLDIEPAEFCFSPARSREQQNLARREKRQTPLWASHVRNQAGKRKKAPQRAPRDRYDVASYRRAIKRACEEADKEARKKDPSIPADQVVVPPWSPNRLRHNRATELRPHGLDLTKTILGHSKVETSLIYAEKDLRAAMALVSKVG
jgi:integrase